jgi:hypothetical protein
MLTDSVLGALVRLNYRRGFQRVFAAGSFFWIIRVLALSIREHPRQIDYDALAEKSGAIEVNPSEVTALPKSQFGGVLVCGGNAPSTNLISQVREARQNGCSDDQILGYLSKTRSDLAPKIAEAKQNGYGASDIVTYLGSGAPHTLDPPTVPPVNDWQTVSPTSPLRVVKSEPLPSKTQRSYWIYSSALALIPPVLGYLFLFRLLPWIWRGFAVTGPEISN